MGGTTPKRGWGARRVAGVVTGALLVTGAIWAGCTVTPENYDQLRFWFDGVPPPFIEGEDNGANIRRSQNYTAHQPWLEQKCYDCHEGRFTSTGINSSVCLKCHEEVTTSLPRMHGPVVAVACLWCHAPHESGYSALLKGRPRDVCSVCHSPEMLGTDQTPEHEPSSEVSCLECHYGHGGTVRYFLRAHGRGLAPPGQQSPADTNDAPFDEPAPAEGETAP